MNIHSFSICQCQNITSFIDETEYCTRGMAVRTYHISLLSKKHRSYFISSKAKEKYWKRQSLSELLITYTPLILASFNCNGCNWWLSFHLYKYPPLTSSSGPCFGLIKLFVINVWTNETFYHKMCLKMQHNCWENKSAYKVICSKAFYVGGVYIKM